MRKSLIIFLIVLYTHAIISCKEKNYCNETLLWTLNIPKGMSIDSVKLIQPDFCKINWDFSEQLGNTTDYQIVWIKGDEFNDMSFLTFVDGKFVGAGFGNGVGPPCK